MLHSVDIRNWILAQMCEWACAILRYSHRLTGPNQQHFSDRKFELPNRGSAHIFPGVLHLKVCQHQSPVREGLGPTGRQITTRPWPLHLRLPATRRLATDGLILSLGDDEDFRVLDCRGIGKEIIDQKVLPTYYTCHTGRLNSHLATIATKLLHRGVLQEDQYTFSTLGLEVSLSSEILGINPWPNGITPNSSQLESLRQTSFPIPALDTESMRNPGNLELLSSHCTHSHPAALSSPINMRERIGTCVDVHLIVRGRKWFPPPLSKFKTGDLRNTSFPIPGFLILWRCVGERVRFWGSAYRPPSAAFFRL